MLVLTGRGEKGLGELVRHLTASAHSSIHRKGLTLAESRAECVGNICFACSQRTPFHFGVGVFESILGFLGFIADENQRRRGSRLVYL